MESISNAITANENSMSTQQLVRFFSSTAALRLEYLRPYYTTPRCMNLIAERVRNSIRSGDLSEEKDFLLIASGFTKLSADFDDAELLVELKEAILKRVRKDIEDNTSESLSLAFVV